MMAVTLKWPTCALAALMFAGLASATVPAHAAAQDSCESLVTAFTASLSRGDFKGTVNSARRILEAGLCPAATRADIARKAALAHAKEAGQMSSRAGADAARVKLLEAGAQFGQPWQLMAMIGDLRQRVPNSSGKIDRGAASQAYLAALVDAMTLMRAEQAGTPVAAKPPSREELARLTRLAQQTRLLAVQFVRGDVLMNRDLQRGAGIEAVPVPVQFVRDHDEMTALGREYAEETFKLLRDQQQPPIVLVGHTDPDGPDQYNLDLSLRRAEALKKYFAERNYPPGKIDAQGKGKREPLRIENESSYSQRDIFQILRRVEVQFRQ